jgi:hypothetical protein
MAETWKRFLVVLLIVPALVVIGLPNWLTPAAGKIQGRITFDGKPLEFSSVLEIFDQIPIKTLTQEEIGRIQAMRERLVHYEDWRTSGLCTIIECDQTNNYDIVLRSK